MKTQKPKKKLFEVTFQVCGSFLNEIYHTFTKKEARETFYKEHRRLLDQELKDSMVITEMSKEEFEKKYGFDQ